MLSKCLMLGCDFEISSSLGLHSPKTVASLLISYMEIVTLLGTGKLILKS